MALMFESIRNIFSDVDNFLQETLKNEKLSKSSTEHRQSLLDKINKILVEYPQLAPEKNKTDVDKGDESSRTGGSSTTEDGEDPYSDQKFPDVAAQDIKDDVISGFLEKKQKRGIILMAKLQKRWCVIKDDCLYYYENKKDKKQRGAFCLSGYSFQAAPDFVKEANKKDLSFEVVCQGKRTFQFVALNTEDLRRWKSAIEKVTGTQKIYDDDPDDIYEPIDEPLVESSPPSKEPQPEQAVESEEQDIYDDTAPAPGDDDDQETYDDCGNMATPSPVVPSRNAPRTQPTATGRKPLPPVPNSQTPPPLPPPSRSHLNPPPPPPPRENKPDAPETKRRKIVNPKEDFENLYYGKWDFSGGTNDELTFKKGDMIHVISKEFDAKSWWVGELQGSYGLVPKFHLAPAYEAASA
ncbi:src kinase-associated phosphoprotein 2-A-like isoform X2 [Mizuhopecten yessoensis]|uniref:src kinase-associated phosphoprotein 2-A-like isoform X2 n=1 Tax=Mizuhopecten yessoensis TaxID=6573 RepID=UPI000B45C132|nr:src kinase-associated phosphoprotein 2-A-like isoform X2 [Mizuhopecten yessoensis]